MDLCIVYKLQSMANVLKVMKNENDRINQLRWTKAVPLGSASTTLSMMKFNIVFNLTVIRFCSKSTVQFSLAVLLMQYIKYMSSHYSLREIKI